MNIDLGNWVDAPDHFVKLALAFLLALPVAWTREREERSAGLRTFSIVAVASCGYVIATQALLTNSPDGLSRIIQGLITGIGFIGSGAILKSDRRLKVLQQPPASGRRVPSAPPWRCASMTSPQPSVLLRLSPCGGWNPRNGPEKIRWHGHPASEGARL